MQTLKAYLYPIVIEVQIPDPTIFTLRKRTVYSHPIKVYKGADNPVQIVFNNQDNKPVDLTGSELRVYVQDPTTGTTVCNLLVNFADITSGHGTVNLNKDTLDSLDERLYKLAIKRVQLSDSQETPVYVDANYGVPIDLMVLAGYYNS